jgi:hypothetical protein
MYPLPAPRSVPKKAPVKWDPTAPYKGLGFRSVNADVKKAEYQINESMALSKSGSLVISRRDGQENAALK